MTKKLKLNIKDVSVIIFQVFITLFLLFIVLYVIYINILDESSKFQYNFMYKYDANFEGMGGGKVFDCFVNYNCVVKEINITPVNCNEWYTVQPIDSLHCDYSHLVKDIKLVADPANHIKSKFTNINYSVEILTLISEIDISRVGRDLDFWLFSKEGNTLNLTWDLEFFSDGTFLVTQKNGKVFHYKNGEFVTVAELPVLNAKNGLMGLAIDPEFGENQYVYLYYQKSFDNSFPKKEFFTKSRISRFVYNGKKLFREKVLVDDIPGSLAHSGGRLEIGPDNKLYATTGDGSLPIQARNISFLGGKILRINLDGSVPADNPFTDSYVYSLGHRNPQGLAWHPETGKLYETEHGPWRYDEINLIEKGGDYGWNNSKCDKIVYNTSILDENIIIPLKCFKEWTLAPSGAVFVNERDHPWYGNLFVAGLRGKHIHRFEIENDNIVNDDIFFINKLSEGTAVMHSRFRDIEFYNGSLWVLSDASGIIKLTPKD